MTDGTSQARWDIRIALPEDLNFVAAAWFESYLHGGKCPVQSRDEYKRTVGPVINRLVHTASVFVAYSLDVPDLLLGFVVVENDVLHYVYVKNAFRKLGIGRKLMQYPFSRHTFLTNIGKKVLKKSAFNPFLLESIK